MDSDKCHGEITEERNDGEIRVSCKSALEDHNINVCHGQMPTNEELRFRFRSGNDNTGYIRTEAKNGAGWQKSHFHKHLKETYIVQKGWILYAILKEDKRAEYYKVHAGQQFTTEPYIPHNIYMSKDSIVHTVKHGDNIPGGDWFGNEDLNKYTKDLNQECINNINPEDPAILSKEVEQYTDDYKHFDNLIWQIPAWSTALFTFAFSSLPFKLEELFSSINNVVFYNYFGYMFLGFILFVFSFTLFRFRLHQVFLKKRPKKTSYFLSPQIYLNIVVLFQSAFFIVLAIIDIKPFTFLLNHSFLSTSILAMIITIIFELCLYTRISGGFGRIRGNS